jgi:uncharacterized membrane protein
MKKRMTNPYFWTGIIAVLITALGVNPSELVSWDSLGQLFIDLGKNPFLIGTALWALITVYIDPSTGGLKDYNPSDEELSEGKDEQ